ncbi:MAG TPA: hypothetical protein VNW95_05800 [Mucilaginibacter sp.]|jgi:hypothetical protein|nr:hypothetical protein [Mucilaginibacter sp.]
MKTFLQHIALIILLLASESLLHAQTILPSIAVPVGWKEKGFVVKIKDQLNHPLFSWPQTRLKYLIDFGTEPVSREQLHVVDANSGNPVVFQLTDVVEKSGLLQKAILNIVTDMPSGGDKSIRLTSAGGNVKAGDEKNAVSVQKTPLGIILNNGLVRVQLPASGGGQLIAPILNYGNSQTWLGHGEMPASLKLIKLTVQEIANGSLFAEYKLLYDFDGNRQYDVNIRLVKGMEFVEMEENMKGFNANDSLAWRIVWDGVNPEYRYIPNRGDRMKDPKLSFKGGYNNIDWEPMEGSGGSPNGLKHPDMDYDQQNQKDGKLPFRLAPYDNWISWWQLPTAAFWSEKENTTIGLFIKDTEKWDDGQYDLWVSKSTLCINFHWKNKVLDYSFPLAPGTRSTGIALYRHEKDINTVNTTGRGLVYIDYLRRWYGWLSYDKVKSWVLTYNKPEDTRNKYFKAENISKQTAASFEQSMSTEIRSLAYSGERGAGPTPVGTRSYYDHLIPAFDLVMNQMDNDQLTRVRAWYLFMNYVFMDESLMPIHSMLSGHPNFLADIKGVTGLTAFLLPNWPMAKQSADHFEKFVNLNFNYHIRPNVDQWDAKGGRWTENLSTYVWAAIKPTVRTSALLHDYYDGRNRLVQPGVSMLGDYILNATTSPILALGNRRLIPPQGAHASTNNNIPSDLLRQFAQGLVYYDPLLADYLFWVTTGKDNPFEIAPGRLTPWADVLKTEWMNNGGTNPHLTSSKYTGYGFVLRSRFGTKDEMYVNLQQIDEGPNYRWGRAADGGNGVIYYYAQGKRYSHNGQEDVGDGAFGDVERITNFGVKKAPGYRQIGPYRSVGRNDLTEPLYDFGIAQMATIMASAKAAPDYISRSVLQSGADYIVVLDKVANKNTEGRFSWFTDSNGDFPEINQLKPGVAFTDADITPSQTSYHKDPVVMPTKGRYYDGKGDFLTLVTHKQSIKAKATDYGCDVQLEDGQTDRVFRNPSTVNYKNNGLTFTGTAGIIKQFADKTYAAALFEGTAIGIPALTIQINSDNKAGVSIETTTIGFKGKFQGARASTLKLFFSQKPKTKDVFYIDGQPTEKELAADGSFEITFTAGKHNWQYSSIGVVPQPAQIENTVVISHGVNVKWQPVAGATAYLVQISKDGGSNWADASANLAVTNATITNLTNDSKVHVRVIAKGLGGQGEPSNDYPVYVTDKVPHAPEGILVNPNGPRVKITWGQILGAAEYKLYRRERNAKPQSYIMIYSGGNHSFMDNKQTSKIFEYVVTAINGNGESLKSVMSDSDPSSFLNWEPIPGEGFRRDTRSHENEFSEYNPFVEDMLPVLTYPNNATSPGSK